MNIAQALENLTSWERLSSPEAIKETPGAEEPGAEEEDVKDPNQRIEKLVQKLAGKFQLTQVINRQDSIHAQITTLRTSIQNLSAESQLNIEKTHVLALWHKLHLANHDPDKRADYVLQLARALGLSDKIAALPSQHAKITLIRQTLRARRWIIPPYNQRLKEITSLLKATTKCYHECKQKNDKSVKKEAQWLLAALTALQHEPNNSTLKSTILDELITPAPANTPFAEIKKQLYAYLVTENQFYQSTYDSIRLTFLQALPTNFQRWSNITYLLQQKVQSDPETQALLEPFLKMGQLGVVEDIYERCFNPPSDDPQAALHQLLACFKRGFISIQQHVFADLSETRRLGMLKQWKVRINRFAQKHGLPGGLVRRDPLMVHYDSCQHSLKQLETYLNNPDYKHLREQDYILDGVEIISIVVKQQRDYVKKFTELTQRINDQKAAIDAEQTIRELRKLQSEITNTLTYNQIPYHLHEEPYEWQEHGHTTHCQKELERERKAKKIWSVYAPRVLVFILTVGQAFISLYAAIFFYPLWGPAALAFAGILFIAGAFANFTFVKGAIDERTKALYVKRKALNEPLPTAIRRRNRFALLPPLFFGLTFGFLTLLTAFGALTAIFSFSGPLIAGAIASVFGGTIGIVTFVCFLALYRKIIMTTIEEWSDSRAQKKIPDASPSPSLRFAITLKITQWLRYCFLNPTGNPHDPLKLKVQKGIEHVLRSVLTPIFFVIALFLSVFALVAELLAWHTEIQSFLHHTLGMTTALSTTIAFLTVWTFTGVAEAFFTFRNYTQFLGNVAVWLTRGLTQPFIWFTNKIDHLYHYVTGTPLEEKPQEKPSTQQPPKGIFFTIIKIIVTVAGILFMPAWLLINAIGAAFFIFKGSMASSELTTDNLFNPSSSDLVLGFGDLKFKEWATAFAAGLLSAAACTTEWLESKENKEAQKIATPLAVDAPVLADTPDANNSEPEIAPEVKNDEIYYEPKEPPNRSHHFRFIFDSLLTQKKSMPEEDPSIDRNNNNRNIVCNNNNRNIVCN